MLKVAQLTFNNFGENTYVLVDTATGEAAVVDPGMFSDSERQAFDKFVAENDIVIKQIILTHGHIDHCFGVNYVHNEYGVPVKAHPLDSPLIESLAPQAERFGMGRKFSDKIVIDVNIKDGDTIKIGESELSVIHVPGHSQGGIALYDKADGYVLTGDSLFEGSIGRTDLPGGEHRTLVNAVKNRLLTLPADTVVLPGHGNFTRIETEKQSNPYLV